MLDALHEDALLARKAAEQQTLQKSDRARTRRSRRASAIRGATSTRRWPPSAACSSRYTYHRERRRLPGPPRRLRAHAGARRRRARQAERRALPRIHRRRAAAHRAAARRRACPSTPSSRCCAWATASSACASGWAPIIPWCASCCRRNRRPALAKRARDRDQARRSGRAPGAVERRLGRDRRVARIR